MDKAVLELRKRARSNELDYGFVMDCLKGYASPRNKLSSLIHSGALSRIKKGLYVFGEPYREGNISKEMLANMIYGPSYVSLEWALSYYGLIPERAEEVTSITTKRKKKFDTPIGRFSYEHAHEAMYPIGLTRYEETPYQTALIATKEKALIDQLIVRRGKITSLIELETVLFDDFRIEEEDIAMLKIDIIESALLAKPHSAITYLHKLLTKLQS
jgi:predicted transcriptional regulator of viral defense system